MIRPLPDWKSSKARAVGSNSALIDGYTAKEGRKFRVLWTSEGYHDLALMVSSKVPEQDVKAVASAFVGIHRDPAGKVILLKASEEVGLDPKAYFLPATSSDYASYQQSATMLIEVVAQTVSDSAVIGDYDTIRNR